MSISVTGRPALTALVTSKDTHPRLARGPDLESTFDAASGRDLYVIVRSFQRLGAAARTSRPRAFDVWL